MESLRLFAVVVMLVVVMESQALNKLGGRSVVNHRRAPLVKRRLTSGPFTNLKIAAFNVRVFGKSKMSYPGVTDILVKIILRYDIILIMEIRDSSQTAIEILLNQVNLAKGSTNNRIYNKIVSPRLGRTTSKEQYAFIYRTDKVSVARSYVYGDGNDTFEREPFIVQFCSTNTKIQDFVLAAIHTSPSAAPAEVDALVDVYDDAVSQWSIKDVIILGDFNSACSYMSDSDWKINRLFNDRRFNWVISDDVDTTVGGTKCAYDRFVIAGSSMNAAVVPGSAERFTFDSEYNITNDLALKVSDHYPIEMELYCQGLSDALKSVREVTEYRFYSRNPPSITATAIFRIGRTAANILLSAHGFATETTKASSGAIAAITNTKKVTSEQEASQALSLIYSCWNTLLTKDQVDLALYKLVNKEYRKTSIESAFVKLVCRKIPGPVECWVALEM